MQEITIAIDGQVEEGLQYIEATGAEDIKTYVQRRINEIGISASMDKKRVAAQDLFKKLESSPAALEAATAAAEPVIAAEIAAKEAAAAAEQEKLMTPPVI